MSVLLLALAAVAATGYGTLDFDPDVSGPPPVRYQHNASVRVSFTDQAAIHRECPLEGVVSCADVGLPSIWIDNPCLHLGESYARRLCHELAHTNGWSARHPR